MHLLSFTLNISLLFYVGNSFSIGSSLLNQQRENHVVVVSSSGITGATVSRSNKVTAQKSHKVLSLSTSAYEEGTSEDDSATQGGIPTYNDYKERLEAMSFLSAITTAEDKDDEEDLGQQALEIFDEMYENWAIQDVDSLEPTTEIYNLLIDVYAHINNAQGGMKGVEIADSILKKMEGQEDDIPTPDVTTYVLVMKGWANRKNIKEAKSTFFRLKSSSIPNAKPTTEAYNELFKAYVQSEVPSSNTFFQEVEAILHEMIEDNKNNNGPKPNTESFYLMLSVLSRDPILSKSPKGIEKMNQIMDIMEQCEEEYDNDWE